MYYFGHTTGHICPPDETTPATDEVEKDDRTQCEIKDDHLRCVVSHVQNENSEYNILQNYANLISSWPNMKDNVIERNAALQRIQKMESTFAYMDKAVKVLQTYESEISELKSKVIDHEQYVQWFGANVKQRIHVNFEAYIDPIYLEYISIYGVPSDGIFCEERLAVI
jgi:hypothetical protein